MKKKNQEYDVTQNPLYHDTWKLLRKYRDVVWSLELSVQQVRSKFQIEYGSSIEDFLESIYLAGADLSGSEIEHHARCIERSHKMLKLMEAALELLRAKHKNGESYYWILYYSFLSRSRCGMWKKSLRNCAPTFGISAIVPTTAAEKRPLTPSVQSFGGIPPQIVSRFWNNFTQTKKLACEWH